MRTEIPLPTFHNSFEEVGIAPIKLEMLLVNRGKSRFEPIGSTPRNDIQTDPLLEVWYHSNSFRVKVFVMLNVDL